MAVARQAAINRACSPMTRVEERLDETRDKQEARRKHLEAEQKVRSPFLIGSIEEVNRRISKLDRKLQSYTDLVIESRASDRDHQLQINLQVPNSDRGREVFQRREREVKEVNQFAGIYAIKSTFLSKPSERVKNISKISMNPSKMQLKKDSGKPKFVELHQYPGFDSSELNPLPHGTAAVDVLAKVADAQGNMKHKTKYRPEFERLFYSQMSQAVLQDTFWWLFLSRWQPNEHYQQKLFNRVAHNYVKLLTYAKHPQYRETFLRDYPTLLSQAVYAGFCEAFPDSYRQFDEQFKDELVSLVYQWTVGLKPAPRIWMSWNFDKLQPAGLKQREDLMSHSKANKKSSSLNLDFLDFLPSSQLRGSQSTLNHCGSVSSMSSLPAHKTLKPIARNRRSIFAPPQSQTRAENPKQVHKLQASSLNSPRDGPGVQAGQQQSQENPKGYFKGKGQLAEVKESHDALTPIREFEEGERESKAGDDSTDTKDSGPTGDNARHHTAHRNNREVPIKESHPVGRGPEFVRGVFNIHGQSPLVAHFLRMKNLQADAGMHVRIQRTEVEQLPSLDARTYQDLMEETLRNVKNTERQYQSLLDHNEKKRAQIARSKKSALKEFDKRETSLMGKPKELKKLSDLIMLELKKDQDSVSAGAAAALQAALEAQD